MQRCLWGRGQRGNNAAHLLISSTLSNRLSCETGSFSHHNCHSPQSILSLSFPVSQSLQHSHCLHGLLPHSEIFLSQPAWSLVHCLTGLVVLVDFFFNSLVVRVPCSLIFRCFWLFSDFRLVVILLLVVRGSEGVLPMPPSWPEVPRDVVECTLTTRETKQL